VIHLIRRSRLLALALLLATPALGGAWLQVAHPCPVDAPWAGHPDAGGHGDHDSPGHGETCHCVGSCAASAAAILTAAAAVSGMLDEAPAPPRPPRAALTVPALRPSDRLPPATAPPSLS
jgi:hypothetical protein